MSSSALGSSDELLAEVYAGDPTDWHRQVFAANADSCADGDPAPLRRVLRHGLASGIDEGAARFVISLTTLVTDATDSEPAQGVLDELIRSGEFAYLAPVDMRMPPSIVC